LSLTTHFIELFTKHSDLPLPIKWLLAHKLTQKVLHLSRYTWRCDVSITLLIRLHATSWDAPQSSS
jgi:hypothetical protein